ncbi:MAG: hypothetical protein WDN28_15850 [Chthoniobacter sp.]
MARHVLRSAPAEKSKTDLRRGQFTPGVPATKKTAIPRAGNGTSAAEQALLLGEPPAGAT